MQMFADIKTEFRRQKAGAEKALAQVTDDQFFATPGELVNPIALIIKHMAGNLVSRWSEFLTTDGEKDWRDRDGEFLLKPGDSRDKLMADWEKGWAILLAALDSLTPADLAKTVHIRNEPMPAQVAVLRALTHVSYHVGQIAYLRRLLQPGASWLTIAPGESKKHIGAYTKPIK